MRGLLLGVAFGLRSSWRQPAQAIVSILLLGAATAALVVVAAVLDALIVRPPTARAPEELVFVQQRWAERTTGKVLGPHTTVSRPDYLELRDGNSTFVSLFAYDEPTRVTLGFGTNSVEIICQSVSANFFSTLDVPLLEGRAFTDADELEHAQPAAVISQALQQRWGVRLGDRIEINARVFGVIGVLPASYESVERRSRPEVWLPLPQATAYREEWVSTNPGFMWLHLGGRLKPHVSPAGARTDLEELAQRLAVQVDPNMRLRPRFSVSAFLPARLALDPRARLTLLLGGAVAALFGLAFTNFFGLSLLRLLARRREVALRLALGATRGAIGSWLVGELAALLLLGVALGWLTGAALLRTLRLVPDIERLLTSARVALDGRALGFGLVSALLAGAAVWLALVRQVDETDLLAAIKETAAASRPRRSANVLLGTQMALALCLVGLSLGFLQTLQELTARPLAFRAERTFYSSLDVRKLGWFQDRNRSDSIYRMIVERLRQAPGVLDAAVANRLPMEGQRIAVGVDADQAAAGHPQSSGATFSFVSPGYWNTFGLTLRSGRAISEEESSRAAYVAVINRSMAQRFWSNEAAALGRTFVPWDEAPPVPVVGVVDDVVLGSDERVEPHFYLPYTTTTNPTITFVVHLQPGVDVQGLSAALREVWPDPSPSAWHPILEHVSASRQELTAAAIVASWVALLAITVTACGLYFFSAFTAAQTVRDSALRMALGALPIDLVRHQLQRYGRGIIMGMLFGEFIVIAARPTLLWLDVNLRAPQVASVVFATMLLTLVALAGLCAPLWRLRHVDIIRTLDPK